MQVVPEEVESLQPAEARDQGCSCCPGTTTVMPLPQTTGAQEAPQIEAERLQSNHQPVLRRADLARREHSKTLAAFGLPSSSLNLKTQKV